MPDPRPRKLPRQARSKATFDAIVQACTRLLRTRGYAAITTNHIAARAGVSIGTLYEFFPNKEAIVAAVAERTVGKLLVVASEAIETALAMPRADALAYLVPRIVEAIAADARLHQVLFREIAIVAPLDSVRRATTAAFELALAGAARARGRRPDRVRDADAWLIGRMVYFAILEIAFREDRSLDADVLTRELVRLTSRMLDDG